MPIGLLYGEEVSCDSTNIFSSTSQLLHSRCICVAVYQAQYRVIQYENGLRNHGIKSRDKDPIWIYSPKSGEDGQSHHFLPDAQYTYIVTIAVPGRSVQSHSTHVTFFRLFRLVSHDGSDSI
jgi:hypothetical protein